MSSEKHFSPLERQKYFPTSSPSLLVAPFFLWVLHSFTGGADGRIPVGAVVLDAVGNLYGTTYYGGPFDSGTVFKIDTAGTETVLYSFTVGVMDNGR
jgi:uncharacterized repeat protein (TIGR03803 family)